MPSVCLAKHGLLVPWTIASGWPWARVQHHISGPRASLVLAVQHTAYRTPDAYRDGSYRTADGSDRLVTRKHDAPKGEFRYQCEACQGYNLCEACWDRWGTAGAGDAFHRPCACL